MKVRKRFSQRSRCGRAREDDSVDARGEDAASPVDDVEWFDDRATRLARGWRLSGGVRLAGADDVDRGDESGEDDARPGRSRRNVARISREADAEPERTSRLVANGDDKSRIGEARTRAGPDALERAEGDAFQPERSSNRHILARRTRSPTRRPDAVRLLGCPHATQRRHRWTFRHPKVGWCTKNLL